MIFQPSACRCRREHPKFAETATTECRLHRRRISTSLGRLPAPGAVCLSATGCPGEKTMHLRDAGFSANRVSCLSTACDATGNVAPASRIAFRFVPAIPRLS